MKKLLVITTIALWGAGPTWAHDEHFGDNPDLYASPLAEHGKGTPTGEPMKGEGDLYGSHMVNPEDVKPNYAARPEMPTGKAALHDQDPEGYGFN